LFVYGNNMLVLPRGTIIKEPHHISWPIKGGVNPFKQAVESYLWNPRFGGPSSHCAILFWALSHPFNDQIECILLCVPTDQSHIS
jgi:hypothetical protein